MSQEHDPQKPQAWQTRHDKLYWTQGKCCAGCDHWRCFSIKLGRCGRSLHMPGPDAWRHIFTSPVRGREKHPPRVASDRRSNRPVQRFESQWNMTF